MTEEPAHHSLGASAAHRWMNCPGSVREIAKLPKGDDSTEHSREGTLAHEHAAALLLEQMQYADGQWPCVLLCCHLPSCLHL